MIIMRPEPLEAFRAFSEFSVNRLRVKASQDGFFHPIHGELSQLDHGIKWSGGDDFLYFVDLNTEEAFDMFKAHPCPVRLPVSGETGYMGSGDRGFRQ